MNRKPYYKITIGIVLFLFGYFTAVLSTNKKIYVDSNSGRIKEEVNTFPFTFYEASEGGAFGFLFPRPHDHEESWKLVDVRRHTPKFANSSYVGGRIIRAEKLILAALKDEDYSQDRRDAIGKEYYQILDQKGVSGVAEFAQLFFETSANTPD